MWNGCGGPTWATWRNPAVKGSSFQALGNALCAIEQRTWDCGDTIVRGGYKCA
ncbi:hypothetical protein B0T14DRAFT_518080 [Immersiella caudata]|uniref:Uncharacterized protein n=1 Tax=Immersiella caudata TaxID=314043 RepID=A0AA39WNZ0_9PEZI|nr:hypothetical protein B0T14DRAFT_518080 [Immersiella caudata]